MKAAQPLSVGAQSGMLGTVSGFSAGDAINFLNETFTKADQISYSGNSSGGTLTITDPSTSRVLATVDFDGSYEQSEFEASGTA